MDRHIVHPLTHHLHDGNCHYTTGTGSDRLGVSLDSKQSVATPQIRACWAGPHSLAKHGTTS